MLETAWSVLWNITDETGPHSMFFLEQGGMDMFLRCRTTFPDNSSELLRNMMGLLGNVAEDRECRKLLMEPFILTEFSYLLDSTVHGIEISHSAAMVLAHLGRIVWQVFKTNVSGFRNKYVDFYTILTNFHSNLEFSRMSTTLFLDYRFQK